VQVVVMVVRTYAGMSQRWRSKGQYALHSELWSTRRAVLKGSFRTHNFDDLKLLAGMEHAFTLHATLPTNWSVASKRRNARRYEPIAATGILEFTLVADVRKVLEVAPSPSKPRFGCKHKCILLPT
jgi:hypothetical protein